jgi:hypothetical protein
MRVKTKSNGVAKTIDNIIDVVKDRIQDQTVDIEPINMICMFFVDPLTKVLPPSIFVRMLLA